MEKGYFKTVKRTIHVAAVPGVPAQGHDELIAEYPNGSKDYKWVVDVPGTPAIPEHDEDYWEQVWVDYTPEELAEHEIAELKKFLADTDYAVIKIQEAIIDDDAQLVAQRKHEYFDVLLQRKTARERINELTGE